MTVKGIDGLDERKSADPHSRTEGFLFCKVDILPISYKLGSHTGGSPLAKTTRILCRPRQTFRA